MIGALLFGSIEVLVPRLQAIGIAVPTFFLFMLPYITTLVVLTVSALMRRHSAIDPDALGRPYAREDRH